MLPAEQARQGSELSLCVSLCCRCCCLVPVCREPVKSKGPIPFHLYEPLKRSLTEDQFVADSGNIVFYQKATS